MRKLILILLILFCEVPNLFAESNPPDFLNRLFNEQVLTVTQEGDSILAGTFRTVLIQAMGIRQNNPFTLVRINFEPSVKKIRLSKGNLPPIEKGFITIDCANKVTFDGSQIDSSNLEAGEQPRGLNFQSSGNALKSCRLIGFKGPAVILAGNQNQIRENIFGETSKNIISKNQNTPLTQDISISISEKASENLIEANEFIQNKQEAIVFNAEAGPGNRIVGNSFINFPQRIIQTNQNSYRTSKINLRPIVKEGESYLISGTVSDQTEVEIFMNYLTPNKENRMTMIVPSTSLGKGDFSLSVKSKGFIPGTTQVFALGTATHRNTSDFSDPVIIPAEIPKTISLPKEVVKVERFEKPEEKKSAPSNTVKPINEGSDSAFSTASSAPSHSISEETISQLPSIEKSAEPMINLSSNPKISGSSDSVKTDPSIELNPTP